MLFGCFLVVFAHLWQLLNKLLTTFRLFSVAFDFFWPLRCHFFAAFNHFFVNFWTLVLAVKCFWPILPTFGHVFLMLLCTLATVFDF